MPIFNNFLSHPRWRPFLIFAKIAKDKNAYVLKTVLDRAISTKYLVHKVSLQSSHPNFQKNFCLAQNGGHFEFFEFFAKLAKHKIAYISKTMLDRADYANFGCHNSIRLKAEHFVNTLALTFISFSGRFVFAVQKHYLFFASDPLVPV